MKVFKIAAVGLMLAASVRDARAQQTLTFEGFAPSTVITTQFPGINFQGATILTLGVDLNPNFPPRSGVNVVFNPVGPMELLFSNDLSFFEGYFTYNAGLLLQGFDVNGSLLTSANALFSVNSEGSGNPSNELVGITGAGIRRVVITGGSGNNFTMDDARFTGSTTVPEPASLLLVASGATMLAFVRRRRQPS